MRTSREPSSDWTSAATSWEEAIDRYVAFRMTPSRRGVTQRNGVAIRELSPPEAERLRRKLSRQLSRLAGGDGWPARPELLTSVGVDRLLELRRCDHRRCDHGDSIWDLWRAALFDRCGYTCRYCGRSAWSTLQEPGGLTIRFALDHLNPKYRDENRDDFDLENIVVACRSCNHIKGAMDLERFHEELTSLGRAIAQKYFAETENRAG